MNSNFNNNIFFRQKSEISNSSEDEIELELDNEPTKNVFNFNIQNNFFNNFDMMRPEI